MMDKRKAKCGGYGMFTGVCGIVILGLLFGFALSFPFKPEEGWTPSDLAAVGACGIAIAFIVLSALDWITQNVALLKNPLPHDLDLTDRSVALERVSALSDCTILQRHIRRLLLAWGNGASGPQIVTMAGNQMLRILGLLVAEAAAILVLLFASAGFAAPGGLLTLMSGLMVLISLVAIARFQLASKMAGYIESHLLTKIGNDTPAAASLEFAKAVAKSVSDSTAALATAQTQFATQLVQSQDKASAQLVKAQQDTAAQMAKAQLDAASQLSKAQQDAASQIVKTQQEAAALVSKTQQDATTQITKAQTEMTAKLSSTQEETAAQLVKAQVEIATQLGRVTALASTIDNVLKLQQSVDGTLKGISAAEEFKSTLVELHRHLSESDAILKNATKPRTIRLVEKDNE